MLWVLPRITLESPEYPQLMFLWRNNENYPENYHQIPSSSNLLNLLKLRVN